MAKIVSTKDLTTNIVKTFLEVSTKDYSTFLQSAPIFVTYYSKDLLKSSYDTTFENVNEVIGADSPVIFNKVNDLPIYSTESASFTTEITDFGISGDVSSSFIMIPNTVTPNVDDIFTLFYDNIIKVFVVSNVEIDKYNNLNFYKVSFYLSSSSINDVENQVSKSFRVDFNNIGKSSKPLIEEDSYAIGIDLKVIYNGLLEYYINTFYDKRILAFVNNYQLNSIMSLNVIDTNINYFIKNNKLNYFYDGYRDFTLINNDYIDIVKLIPYSKTLLANIDKSLNEIKTKTTLTKARIVPANDSVYGNNWMYKTKYNYIEMELGTSIENSVFNYFYPYSLDLIDRIDTNNITGITNQYHLFIIRYLNGAYTNLNDMVNDLNTLDEFTDNFYTFPLCIKFLKDTIHKLFNHI
jgi:hypothetical protein